MNQALTLSTSSAMTTDFELLFENLLTHKAKMAVVGLGYVGLPLALEFAKTISVIGYDIKDERVQLMNKGFDPSGELNSSEFEDKHISFSCSPMDLVDANFFVVAVPTPINANKTPNLKALKGATQVVAQSLKKGDFVTFESTVYPGCTEEVCIPILEEISGLKLNQDFKVGYSPERINPGDKRHTLTTIKKIVSGSDATALKLISDVYDMIIEPGVHQAETIKVAEAAKIVENTQRDVNIALMNELSLIFNKLDINTADVLKAAGTKWNFLNFYPGLVGGHCIGVDPYYLSWKANQEGVESKLIDASRATNDFMPLNLANRVIDALDQCTTSLKEAKVLVRGITFKEDVQDIRNSKIVDTIKTLQKAGVAVEIEDPLAVHTEVEQYYNLYLTDQPIDFYDAIILAVPHKQFAKHDILNYMGFSKNPNRPVIFDLRNSLKNVPDFVDYHTL